MISESLPTSWLPQVNLMCHYPHGYLQHWWKEEWFCRILQQDDHNGWGRRTALMCSQPNASSLDFCRLIVISIWISQWQTPESYPMVLAPDRHTLFWCGETHCSKGNNGCLSKPGSFHWQKRAQHTPSGSARSCTDEHCIRVLWWLIMMMGQVRKGVAQAQVLNNRWLMNGDSY